MKKHLTYLLLLLAIPLLSQNKYNKVPEGISFQIKELGNDSVEVVYNVDFKEWKGFQFLNEKPQKPKVFKENERHTFRLRKDSIMKITMPPYFLSDTNVIAEQLKFNKSGHELSTYQGYFVDPNNEKVGYADSIGNGTFIIIPSDNNESYTAIGEFNLMHRGYSFQEELISGEQLFLNKTLAIAIRFKSIEKDVGTFWVGHDILNTSKEEPSVSGVRFYSHQIKVNENEPTFVGYDFRGKKKKKKKKIEKMTFSYIPTERDRTENGSFILKSISPNKYRLIGLYSYLGRLFEINHEIAIGEEIGIKKSVPYN